MAGSVQSNSFLALRDATINGVGLSLLPIFCVAPLGTRSELVKVLHDRSMAIRPLQLLMSPDRRRPKRIRYFIDFALKWFDPPPWLGRA